MALRLLLGHDWYTPDQDSESNQYRFKLRRLNADEASELLGMSRTGGDDADIDDKSVKNAVRKSVEMALVDWENMVDESGNDIPFDKTMIVNLPLKTQVDIYREVIRLATLSEEQVKN